MNTNRFGFKQSLLVSFKVLESDWPDPVVASTEILFVPEQV